MLSVLPNISLNLSKNDKTRLSLTKHSLTTQRSTSSNESTESDNSNNNSNDSNDDDDNEDNEDDRSCSTSDLDIQAEFTCFFQINNSEVKKYNKQIKQTLKMNEQHGVFCVIPNAKVIITKENYVYILKNDGSKWNFKAKGLDSRFSSRNGAMKVNEVSYTKTETDSPRSANESKSNEFVFLPVPYEVDETMDMIHEQ
eukprot:Pgem_evm1s5128